MTDKEKIRTISNHISNVQKNCEKLGWKLIEEGDFPFGRQLIANGRIHDNSKYFGFEFAHLFAGDPLLKEAILEHSLKNPHHPEFWGNIKYMPEVYIAEMVCDCLARSSEFGTDIRTWFNDQASVKYGYELDGMIDKKIQRYLDLLLATPFSSENKEELKDYPMPGGNSNFQKTAE